jgi:phosphoglycolate phosphatase
MLSSLPVPGLRYRLVVFDWDGTLVDSIGSIVACTLAAIADVPGIAAPPAEQIRESIGLGLAETMSRHFPGGDAELFEQVATAYRLRWRAEHARGSTLIAGARATLERLRAEGCRIGVATAKGRAGLERELDQTGLRPLVDASRTVDEAPSKPAPGMLLGLFEALGVAPRDALMVGDTRWDLEMAANAGCAAVGVLSGAQTRPLLEAAGPLACLGSVAELPGWLGLEPAR